MSVADKTVRDNAYRIGKMSAIQQFHVTRRLGAVSGALGEGLSRLVKSGGAARLLESGGDGAMTVIEPLLTAIGRMTDEDSNYVINTCLAHVTRRVGETAWSPVQSSPGNMMFPDVDMFVMLVLVWHVLEFNLQGFFSALLSALPDPAAREQR